MVKVKGYNYPEDCMETVKINKKIKMDMAKFCRVRKISKSRLVENFYKSVLLKFKEGSLNTSSGYVTLNINA